MGGAPTGGGGAPATSPGSPPLTGAAREARLKELAADPAHDGKITPKTMREAECGLGLEEANKLEGITRYPGPAAEFLDKNKQAWDVKGFYSSTRPVKGAFTLDDAMKEIRSEIKIGENIIVDTEKMSDEHIAQLRAAITAENLDDNVLWYPIP